MFGQFPATDVRAYARCYLKDGSDDSSQLEAINDFDRFWSDRMKKKDDIEYPTIFPGPRHIGGTCDTNETISEAIRNDLRDGRKIAYIVGAARFRDSTGEHEAHTCTWLETHPDKSEDFYSRAWQGCIKYTGQTNISK